jgi:hypothetical protein
MVPLFMGDDEELQAIIRDYIILPYLFGDFHPSHIQEYAVCLLIALEKPANPDGSPGGISKLFTSTYEKFLQTAGLQDGASHCQDSFRHVCLTQL